jgi:hypothetical protein
VTDGGNDSLDLLYVDYTNLLLFIRVHGQADTRVASYLRNLSLCLLSSALCIHYASSSMLFHYLFLQFILCRISFLSPLFKVP